MENIDALNLGSNRKCAEVCFVKSPSSFWARLDELKDQYYEMASQLQVDYQDACENPVFTPKNLSLGSLYCAFDQKLYEWQRCEVLLITKNDVSILYIDIGATDLVPIKSIKILKDFYKSINRFAIHCSLYNVKPAPLGETKWSSQAISTFYKYCLNKVVTLDLKSKVENIYHVDLYLKTMNIGEQLAKENLAIIDSSNLDQSLTQERSNLLNIQKFIKTPNVEINDKIPHEVVVTAIYSPFCFFVQLNQNLQEFFDFEESIQSYYSNENLESVLSKRPQLGQMCMAKYNEDGRWYRAIVKDIDYDLNKMIVFFVDYGNEDVLPIDGKSVVKIHDKFKHYPTIALKCCLNGVKPVAEAKDYLKKQEIVDYMYDAMSGKVLAYFVGKKYVDDCYLVNITVDHIPKLVNLSDLLAERNYVKQLQDIDEIAKVAHKRTSVNEKYINKLVKDQIETNLKPRSKTSSISESGDTSHSSTPKFKIYSDEINIDSNNEKKSVDVKITHVETVNEFYVQLCQPDGDENMVNIIMHNLNVFYERKSNLPMPLFKPYNACVYFDDERNKWYRARILNLIDEDHCIVSLVDYGIKKFVNRATLREIYDKFLNPCCQAVMASLDDIADDALENIDEQLHCKFKQIGLGKKFIAKIKGQKEINDSIEYINSQGDTIMAKKIKYILNLFDENGESVFSELVQDINNSINAAPCDKFKPKVRSKLEETVLAPAGDLSINTSQNQSLNQSRHQSKGSYSNQLIDNYYSQKCILEDETSPFPVHVENFKTKPHSYKKSTEETQKSALLQSFSSEQKDEVDHVPVRMQRGGNLNVETAQISKLKEVEPELFKKIEEPVKPVKPISPAQTVQPVSQLVKENKCFYYENKLEIDLNKPYAMNITHFNHMSSFFAQITDLFLEFDANYEEFQAFCDGSSKVSWDEFKSNNNLDKIAIAAKYSADNVWYRARICVEHTSNNEFLNFKNNKTVNNQSHEILIEFIDYGNRQVTSLDEIVYLDEKFSCFKPCSIKCNGISYLSTFSPNKVNDELVRSLLLYAKLPGDESNFEPYNWSNAYFIKPDSGKLFLEIDDLYKLFYSLKLVDTSFYLDPKFYSEKILKQADEEEIKSKITQLYNENKSLTKMVSLTYDAIICNLNSGLKYFYVNLAQSIDELHQLENKLENERRDSLIKLDIKDLVVNRYYLANHNNRLCRVIKLSDTKVQLIDHGNRITIQQPNLNFYVLTPRYFKYGSFALHCRLAMGANIEKVWTKDEEANFIRQIQTKRKFKIKILSLYEPYIIEIDESSKIDFQFRPIIERINKNELCLEPPTILDGNKMESFESEFHLGGNFFKSNEIIKLNLFDGPHLKEKFLEQQLLTLCSRDLMKKFKFYSNYFNESINNAISSDNSEIVVKSLNKGDIVLSKTASFRFLNSLKPEIKELVQNKWCRVKIKSILIDETSRIQSRVIQLYYCDFGLEDEFVYNESSSKEFDYRFVKLLPIAKVIPKLLFDCHLDKLALEAKLEAVVKINDFVDFNYMNNKVDASFLSDNTFKVDFTKFLESPKLSSEPNDRYTVEIYDEKSKKNIIDLIVDKGLKELCEHTFTCIITHINSFKDFYIQKYDPISEEILAELQETIQTKVLENKLKNMELIEPNNICVSYYGADGQYYRAKVINLPDNKPIKAFENKDMMIEVFYIDYGNTSYVRVDQLKEITFDLIENLPKAYAINCELKLEKELSKEDLNEFATYFLSLIEDMDSKYEVKCLKRKSINKYIDSGFYEVEIYDHSGKIKLIDSFCAKRMSDTTNVTSLTKIDNDLSNDSTLDDKAIADSLTMSRFDETTANATNATGLDTFSYSKMIPNRDSTIMSNLDTSKRNQPSVNPSQSMAKDQTWFETPPHLKNYNAVEYTINTTLNQTGNESWLIEKSLRSRLSFNDMPEVKEGDRQNKSNFDDTNATLTGDTEAYDEEKSVFEKKDYSPNKTLLEKSVIFEYNKKDNTSELEDDLSLSIDAKKPKFITKSKNSLVRDDELYLKNCLISYLDSSQCFSIQMENFEQEIAKMQPEIDECLDPFDLSRSNLCIGQFKEDEKYYRCQCLNWNSDKNEANCVFIDYGNWDMVSIDTITEMSSNLRGIKPLALSCKLDIDSNLYDEATNFLQSLINEGIKINVKMKKSDLDKYYTGKTVFEYPIKVELYSNENEVLFKTKYNLNDLIEIKSEPQSFIETKEPKKPTKSSCSTNPINLPRSTKDDDNDDCEKDKIYDLAPIIASTSGARNSSKSPNSQIQSPTSANTGNKCADKDENIKLVAVENNYQLADNSLNDIDNSLNHSNSDDNQEEIENFISQQNLCESVVSEKPEDYFYDPDKVNENLNKSKPQHDIDHEQNQKIPIFIGEESLRNINVKSKEITLTTPNLHHEDEENTGEMSRCSDKMTEEISYKKIIPNDGQDESNMTRNCFEPDSTVNHENKNKTLDHLPDETIWTASRYSKCDAEDLTIHRENNKDISRLHDEDSNWTFCEPEKTMNDIRNKTIKDEREESMWEPNCNEAQSVCIEDNKNITKSRLEDESMWDKKEETRNSRYLNQSKDSSYLSKTIQDQNVSFWSTDQNKSTFEFKNKSVLSKTADLNEFFDDKFDTNSKKKSEKEEETEYQEVISGNVLYMNSFENFYVQIDNADEKLMNLKLDSTLSKNEKIPPVGSLCIAVSPLDSQCYRAKVIEIAANSYSLNGSMNTSINKSDAKVKVIYYDYGNEEWISVSNLHKITSYFRDLRPLALSCRLNYSNKLKSWLKQQKDTTESIESLFKTFKELVSKSKVVAKVLKKTFKKDEFKQSDLVDLFIGGDNICDLLVLNSISNTKPIQISTIDSTTHVYTNNLNDSNEFEGYIINLNKFKKSSIEIKLINESMVKSINSLCTKISDKKHKCDEFYSLAPIPELIRSKFQQNNRYGRVYVKEKRHEESKDLVLVHFVDYDFEIWVNKVELIKTDYELSNTQSSIQSFNLNLRNSSEIIHLNAYQIEHLFEIFKLLVNYKMIESKLRKNEILELNGWSTKLNGTIVENKVNKLKCNTGLQSIRLIDPLRENLDVNYVLESCLSLMVKPFRGHLTHLENDFSQFDCLHELSSSAIYSFEIKKIFKATMSSSESNGHANGKSDLQLKPGQLCLVDCSKSIEKKKTPIPTSNSILSLSGHAIDVDENEDDETDYLADLDLFRGIVIDETIDKCVVLNVDTGKLLTVTKRRLKPIKSFSDDSDNVELIKKKSSFGLSKLLPFMIIKAKPEKEIGDAALKRLLHKSQYYGERIEMNVIGSWVSTFSNETSINSAFEQANYNKEQESYFRFMQTEKDLFKLVDLIVNEFNEQKLKENEKLDQPTRTTSKSSISILNSANIKRKRSEEPEDKLGRKTALTEGKQNLPSQAYYYTLSHFASINCFYLHTNETSKNLSFIEEQMQLEYESDEQGLVKVKSPKLNSIYGIYRHEQNKYYRIRLVNFLQTTKLPCRRISTDVQNKKPIVQELCGAYEAFYLDYGFTDRVESKDLILISDIIQQIPPQAICCKLYGFQTNRNEFADAEETESNRSNETNELDLKIASELFINLLKNKKFMATMFKRFYLNKCIDNYVPLQSDNTKPIEIAIHVYKENEEESNSLNSSISFMNVLNEEKNSEKSRNLTLIIKNLVDSELKNSYANRKSSIGGQIQIDLQQKKGIRLSLFDLVKKNYEAEIQIEHIVNANQFYIHLSNWNNELKKLNEQMEKDYNLDATLSNTTCVDSTLPNISFSLNKIINNLTEKDLRIGLLCAYVDKIKSIYRRVLIVDLPKKKLSKASSASVYLIDFGRYASVTMDNFYNLLDKYYDIEPLCFECTLSVEANRELEEQVNNQFKRLVDLCKSFKINLIEELKPINHYVDSSILFNRYYVKLFGFRPDPNDLTKELVTNISDELIFFANSLSTSPALPKSNFLDSIKTSPELNSTHPWDKLANKLSKCVFNETEMPLGTPLKIKLTDVDTVNHFGVVLCCQKEKRERFIQKFHQWHKENRKYLKSLVYDNTNKTPKQFIGMPCALSSLQISKWCRGLVLHIDANCKQSFIYLVDYGKSLNITVDRLFKLEKEEFLNEPTYVHRCQLVDEQGQRETFEKYLELLKSNTSMNDSDENEKSVSKDESKSHISIENIEILIACLKREVTPLNIKYDAVSYQYTVNVKDYKRIYPPINTSKQFMDKSNLHNSILPSNGAQDTSYNTSNLIQLLNKDRVLDESTENTLCTSLNDNFPNKQKYLFNNSVGSTSIVSYGSSSIKLPDINHDTKNLEDKNEINQKDLSMYAISESTRIQQDDKDNTTYDNIEDITQTNETNNVSDYINGYGIYINANLFSKSNKREDTSTWLDNDDNKFISSHIDDRITQNSRIKVKLISFNGKEGFICQKVELLKTFERLQTAMNEYYNKLSQFSKSVEPEKQSGKATNIDNLNDSLNEEESVDPFERSFNIGEYCACFIANKWSRCRITDKSTNVYAVECVDDHQTARLALNRIEKLCPNFKMLPRVAFKCQFQAIHNPAKLFRLNVNAIAKFTNLIKDENNEFIAEIVDTIKGENETENLCLVKLYLNDKDVIDIVTSGSN